MTLSSRDLLGEGGRLSHAFAGYEARRGQLAMADAVERALRDERILLCEAGTGTGKTLAYLVPAILSGKRVVVSTATRALQEQIATRDLPMIAKDLGLETRVAVMKGLSNYLCLRRYEDYRRHAPSLEAINDRALALIEAWRQSSRTGDVSELSELAEDEPIWREITSSSDTRVGQGCGFYDECFVTRMRRSAEIAQIIVVNHHLFFADLALRGPHPGHVIPDYDAVIFDEAHQLEDVATAFFGVRISSARIEAVLRDLERVQRMVKDPIASDATIQRARRAADAFWARLERAVAAEYGESRTVLERDIWAGELAERWHDIDSALEGVAAFASSLGGRIASKSVTLGPTASSLYARGTGALTDSLEVASRRANDIREQLAVAIDGAPGRVTWLDRGGRSVALSSTPVDVSMIFRDLIFEHVPAVVLTSATLATETDPAPGDSPFAFLRARLGLDPSRVEVGEHVIASPFDFPNQALFYTPRDLPAPNHPKFLSAASARIAELVTITGGGAFVLTTSLRSMRALADSLRRALPERPLFMQGEAPKRALLERFRQAEHAVLVATQSFWEGVDIPGHALRLVVLEKIPFAVPSDPIVRARSERIEADGGNSFMQLHVPAAALALKQGFGRLIRSRSDYGIVALFDERVHRKGYGKRVLAALPPARRTDSMAEVRDFYRAVTASARAP